MIGQSDMSGLVSKIKKRAKNIIYKTNVLGHDVKALGQAINDVLNEESIVHIMVQQLYTKIKAILDLEEKNLDPQVKEAALCMLEDLKIVIDEDSCRVSLNRCHLSSQYYLAEKSIDILFKYQHKLEAAPGFWNQIKAYINTFIEQISGVKNIFETERTAFSNNENFQSIKQCITFFRDETKSYIDLDEPGTRFNFQ